MIKLSWEGILASVPGVAPRHARCVQPPRNCPQLHSSAWTFRRKFAALNERAFKQRVHAISTVLAPEDDDAVVFCLDSAIADLSYLTITVAYNAAQELWPDRVVGPVGLYVEKARSILPALAESHQAVVLVRLLSDEGVIGARSTAGREGPVVGRAVRNTGSRPLLVAEIAEHWPVVMDSCLLRWSLEGRQLREPGLNSCNGSSRSSGSGGGGLNDSNSSSSSGSVGGNSRDELLARARAAFQAAQTALAQDVDAVQACLARVTPYSTAVEALKGCSRGPLLLASTLPAELGMRVLDRCGLATATAVMEADGAAAAATAAVAPAERPMGLDLICAPSWGGAVVRVLSRAAAGGNRVQLVTGNLARLEQLMEEGGCEAEEVQRRRPTEEEEAGRLGTTAAVAAAAHASAAAAGVEMEGRAGRAALRKESASNAPDVSEGSASACSSGRDASAGPSTSGSSYGQLGRQNARSGPINTGTLPEPPFLARSTSLTTAAAARDREGARGGGIDTAGAAAAAAASSALGRTATMTRGQGDVGRSAGRGADAVTGEGTRPPPPDAAAGAATDAARGIGGGGGGASGSLRGTLRVVHLAEWSCASMSFRARALSHQPRASLLSEHQLAEWLGVTHLDLVMDGVAWR